MREASETIARHVRNAVRETVSARRIQGSGGDENVNALPEGVRRYVHDLETRCDPTHEVQKMALQADTIRGLDARVRELEAELASERRKGERGQ